MTLLTRLGLLEWLQSQNQPHITVNANSVAGLFLHHAAVGKDVNSPPGSVAEGDYWIVGPSPTGAWSAFTPKNVALFTNGGWQQITRIDRLQIWVDDGANGANLWQYDSGSADWISLGIGTSANFLRADQTALLQVGYRHQVHNLGTISSGTLTPSEANGAMQKYTNNGAHTLDPPVNNASLHILMENSGGAAAPTVSNFTKVTGDTITTTNNHRFFLVMTKNSTFSHLHVVALQ